MERVVVESNGERFTLEVPTGATDAQIKAFLQEQEPVDFSFSEMVSNIPGSAAQYGKDIVSAVTHPVESVKAVGSLGGSLLEKLGRSFEEFATGEEIQPREGMEDAANATWDWLTDRYGSIDNAKRTLMEDPVGALADVSTLGTGAGSVTKIPAITKAAQVLEPVNLAARGVQNAYKAGVKAIPNNKPAGWYQEGAKFSTSPTMLTRDQRAQMIQTALDEGVMPTASGVKKVENRIDILNAHLDDLITQAGDGITVPMEEVGRYINDLRATEGGARVGGQAAIRKIDKIAEEFYEDMWSMGKSELTVADLQNLKKRAYGDVDYKPKKRKERAEQATLKTMARGAKDAIVDKIPEAAGINKQLGELMQLLPNLERSASRIENLNSIGLGTPMKVGAGGVLGEMFGSAGAGTAMGVLMTLRDNPLLKTRVAIHVNKIQKGDMDWMRKHRADTDFRLAAYLIGQHEAAANDQ